MAVGYSLEREGVGAGVEEETDQGALDSVLDDSGSDTIDHKSVLTAR